MGMPSYSGFQYDYVYSDQDNDESVKTVFGAVGWDSGTGDRTVNYSGNNYLGSDGDVMHLGIDYAVASGKYVVPENIGAREALARAGDIAVQGGTQFDLDGRLGFGGTVTFQAATGTLQIEQASMFEGTISRLRRSRPDRSRRHQLRADDDAWLYGELRQHRRNAHGERRLPQRQSGAPRQLHVRELRGVERRPRRDARQRCGGIVAGSIAGAAGRLTGRGR